jgi:hypothetical protein
MNFMKVVRRLGLCALFVIGLTYGLSAHATEPEEAEKALHETHEAVEESKHEVHETKAEGEETHETKAEGEEETHETKEECEH